MPNMRTRNHAFTIIELIVVISIIVVLLGISLPAMYRSKKSAKSIRCVSNLKQIGLAFQTYQQDYHEEFFNYSYTFDQSWIALFDSYLSWEEIRFCPEATTPNQNCKWGTADLAWNGEFDLPAVSTQHDIKNHFVGSYGFNGWLYRNRSFGTRNNQIVLRFKVPLFFDCAWANAWPDHTDPPPIDLNATDTDNNTARVALDRHVIAINIATLDGSVKTVKLDKLWKLRWNADSKYIKMPLP